MIGTLLGFVFVSLLFASLLRWLSYKFIPSNYTVQKDTPAEGRPVIPLSKPAPKLMSPISREIMNEYQRLDKEHQRFPDLPAALRLLEEKAIAMQHMDKGGGFFHSYSCRFYNRGGRTLYGHTYEADDMQGFCQACKPFYELKSAVGVLHRAQAKRKAIIAKFQRDLTVAELDAKMNEYTGLADRMRMEADIVNEVTREVYGGSNG